MSFSFCELLCTQVLWSTMCSNRVPYILISETNRFWELSVSPDEDEPLRLKFSLASLTRRRSGPDTLAEVDLAVDCSVFSWVFIVALFWLGPGGEIRTGLLSSACKLFIAKKTKQKNQMKENTGRSGLPCGSLVGKSRVLMLQLLPESLTAAQLQATFHGSLVVGNDFAYTLLEKRWQSQSHAVNL